MKKVVLSVLALIIFISAYSQKDKRLKGIENELNAVLEVTKAPGFAVAVVEGDKVIYAKGFGFRDYENKIPVDANTLFAIGSSTKAFTSAILGKLREDDKLSFNDNPREYIPELKFYNDDLNNNVIIKDLMRHSTGLPRHDGSWYFFQTHDKDSLLQRIAYQEPFTGIRQQWYYNNFMFLAQGIIAEKITGKSWEDNIREHFLIPLGMERSNVTIAEMKSATNAALGYELSSNDEIKKMDYYDIAGMSPAGSINSSVNDMTKWLITWINNGKYGEEQIIPEPYVREAMSSQMVINAALPDEELPDMHFANYGYGWMLQSYRGHYRVEHGGNIDGFSASVAFFPTDKLGIVVLTNQNGSAVTGLVRNTIADRMLEGEKTDWVQRYADGVAKAKEAEKEVKSDTDEAKVKNTRLSHVNMDYTGSYTNKGYGTFEVTMRNDSLFSKSPKSDIYLHHYHYDTFEMITYRDHKPDTLEYGEGLKIKFITNTAGDISDAALQIEPTLDAINFKRTPNSLDIDVKTLNSYTGEYELSGTTIKVYVKNENTLYLFVPGQPEYELIPTKKHLFSFKTLEGFKVEFVEEDGAIVAAKAIQPNGTFVAKRKTE
ncbi:serine hydrolase [Ichthyenterobacterium sp. W332]|uniref:Serine hydrolase n=1 Tax=Microcosmobacter mediterraneus TaxID=3075607 RepID=A0ABU2YK10_9FLAO|nr:serine hydrolase [Ichthyenterobacterium sp. W332]MDT0557383.1 serine hydrolase [Ichthyenterobacterium sp. W332]